MQVEIWHNNRLTTVEVDYTTHTGLAHSDQYENYETFERSADRWTQCTPIHK